MTDDIWKRACAQLKAHIESPAFQEAFRKDLETHQTLIEQWDLFYSGRLPWMHEPSEPDPRDNE